MGLPRFMSANLIPALGMTVNRQAGGSVSRAQKEGAGSAIGSSGGVYTSHDNLDYLVEIDALGTGEIGSSTFKWSNDDGATFEASGVVTAAAPITLENGVTFTWTTGALADFVLGDRWRFKAFHPYHRSKMIDGDRDTEWRSGEPDTGNPASSTVMVTVDLNSEGLLPTCLVILDHNLTSTAQISLTGSSDNFATVPPVSMLVPWRDGRIVHYFSHSSQRYWRLSILDTANSDGYLRISELYLGTYVETDRSFELGDIQRVERIGPRERMLSGRFFGGLNAEIRVFELPFDFLSDAIRAALTTVYQNLNDVANRRVKPILFHADAADASTLALCEWTSPFAPRSDRTAKRRHSLSVTLVEIPRTI